MTSAYCLLQIFKRDTHIASYTYISEGDSPGSPSDEEFPVGNVNSGIFFFTLYAMVDCCSTLQTQLTYYTSSRFSFCCVCLSIRLSVTFVDHVKTNKHIFEIFSPPGSHTILVFPYQTGWQYSDGHPLTGASNAGGVGKKRDSGRISGFTAYRSTVLSTVRVANCKKNKAATNGGKRRAEHS